MCGVSIPVLYQAVLTKRRIGLAVVEADIPPKKAMAADGCLQGNRREFVCQRMLVSSSSPSANTLFFAGLRAGTTGYEENASSQFLSLRQSFREQHSLRAFEPYRSPITAGIARELSHCGALTAHRISLSWPVCL